MSATNAFEAALLALIFNNTDAANIGDATGLQGSGTAGDLYVSLHTADPGETGDQTTNESAYTGYARVAVTRDSGGWTVSGTAPSEAANTASVGFPACTGSTSTVTHFGIGTASSGAGHLLVSGALTSSLAVSSGITPSFDAGELTVTLD